jgi:hypothetical protein
MTAICSSCNVFTGSLRAVFTHIQRDQDHKLQREKRDRIKCQQRKPFLPCHAFCIVSVCYQGTKSFPLVQEIIRHRWGSRPPDDCWLWCAQYCNEHYTQPQNAFLHLHYMKSSLRLAKKKIFETNRMETLTGLSFISCQYDLVDSIYRQLLTN